METQKRENGTENIGYGRWLRFTMGAVLAMLVMLGGLVVWVDPFSTTTSLLNSWHIPLTANGTRMTVSAAILLTTQYLQAHP